MCNACHNMCCGSDQFEACGCDHCDEPDCWSDDFDEGDDDYEFDCACTKPARFECIAS